MPAPTKFTGEPLTTFTILEWLVSMAVGSSRATRRPLTRNSSGWLLVLPRNWPAETLLPPSRQKLLALSPPNVAAFTFVTFAPLPEKVTAVTAPEKLGLVGSAPLAMVPLN